MSIFDELKTDQVIENPLEHLVGEGKRYADAAALAKAAIEKDRFIEQLKKEAAEAREALSGKATMEEIMTQIKSMKDTPPQPPAQQPVDQETPKLTSDELGKIFEDFYTNKQKQERVQTNKQKVEETLINEFGVDAQLRISEKARELGVSTTYLQQVGLDSPTALFDLLGIKKSVVASRVAPVSQQSPGRTPGNGERTQSYYDAMKARDIKEYLSPKIQNQMMKDALRLGEAYFDK